MDQAPAPISVQRSNSRVRVLSAHVIHDSLVARRRLGDLAAADTVTETRSREWSGESYRFGADWLTPQALELLGVGHGHDSIQPSIIQYEVPEREFANLSLRASVRFRTGDRAAKQVRDSVAVGIVKCGAVFTAIDIVLVWVEISFDSDDHDAWLDLTRTIRQRVRPGDQADYLRRFEDTDGTRLAFSDILLPLESMLLGDVAHQGMHAARNLFTFGRYKLHADSVEDVAAFLREASRKTADPVGSPLAEVGVAMSARRSGEEASILHVASLDALAVVLWQLPTEKQAVGAAAFQNAFHLGDLWLSFVVCIVQFQMIVSLERQMLALVGTLDRIGAMPHWSFRRVRDIASVQSRYETVMRSFIQGYWRFGLVQIHSHDRRHRVYAGLRDEMSLDKSLTAFHQKLQTLGSYVDEKQREFLNWLLVYVPFISFLVGVLGINVKGWTSEEGMRPLTLLAMLATLTVIYAAGVTVCRYLVGDRGGRRSD